MTGRAAASRGRSAGRVTWRDMIRLLIFVTVATLAQAVAASPTPVFKVFIEEAGVYALSHEELVAAGLEPVELDSALVGMSNRGKPVPVLIEDGGDGRFGPGDTIEFVAERLSSGGLYYHEYSKFNVYWLSFDGRDSRRMTTRSSSSAVVLSEPMPLERVVHREWDRLLIRIREDDILSPADADLWFWDKLTQIDAKPTSITLKLPGLAREPGSTVDLRVGVRGISRPHPRQIGDMKEHQLDVALNGQPIGSGQWNGVQAYTIELPAIDAALFDAGSDVVELRVPSRQAANGTDAVVDVVMLNWIEVSYPHTGEIPGSRQVRMSRSAGSEAGPGPGVVEARGSAPLVLYTVDGERVEPFITSSGAPGDGGALTVRFDVGGADDFFLTGGDKLKTSRIERDRPSDWRSPQHQADYLMIAHSRLIKAIEPLAQFHRERGLEVVVVDVDELYDEFNDGIFDPTAIRDFIAYAYHEWQRPAPQFVLLVGDASWDTKNAEVDDRNYASWVDNQLEEGPRFPGRNLPTYEGRPAANDRQLIPTWNYTSHEGHSASDNWFVTVDGDDHSPDIAIGRFPVVEPAEVEAIVAKTIAYARDPQPGAWHRNALWITNESPMFQKSSDDLAGGLVRKGYAAYKVYPSSEEATNERHQAALQARLNEGQLIVHFLGHGGRHIWRTGPPDFRKNHDLFTLDHVAQLEPTNRLAFVLSMTCYSAPFDHPNQDSIGETFLRVPNRGAVGVFAASWRNSPSRSFSQLIIDGLTTPGTPVGVAIMNAKRQTQNRTLVETYNLLGDPAIALAVPQESIELTVAAKGGGARVTGRVVGARVKGEGVVEWVGKDLGVVHSERVKVKGQGFAVNVAPDLAARLEGTIGIRAWAMDGRSGRDAVGWWSAPADDAADAPGPEPSDEPTVVDVD
ncbi:MAG: hypothetical protein C3F15_03055 [Holophagae bacterium]|nr:MAG: hypothetical protein C3F15_03055 [Holophagae bacterium]